MCISDAIRGMVCCQLIKQRSWNACSRCVTSRFIQEGAKEDCLTNQILIMVEFKTLLYKPTFEAINRLLTLKDFSTSGIDVIPSINCVAIEGNALMLRFNSTYTYERMARVYHPTLHVLANNARPSYSMGKLYAYVLAGMMEL